MDWTWGVTVVALVGTVANVYRKRWSFLLWALTNGIWIGVDCKVGLYGQAALFVVQTILCIVGWIHWGKEEKKCKTLRRLH